MSSQTDQNNRIPNQESVRSIAKRRSGQFILSGLLSAVASGMGLMPYLAVYWITVHLFANGPQNADFSYVLWVAGASLGATITLLDEATASLDPENELYIQQAIDGLVQEKTVVVIAHRLNTVVHADKIVVLEDGQIVEQGKHDDLMRTEGLYRRMWDEQQKVREWKFGQDAAPAITMAQQPAPVRIVD